MSANSRSAVVSACEVANFQIACASSAACAAADLQQRWALRYRQGFGPCQRAGHVAARLLIEHGVVDVHQPVNVGLFEHLQHLLGLIFRQRIGGQHLLLLKIIQIGAVAADGRGIYLQRPVERMDGDMMAAGDHHHRMPAARAPAPALPAIAVRCVLVVQQGAVKIEGDDAVAHRVLVIVSHEINPMVHRIANGENRVSFRC